MKKRIISNIQAKIENTPTRLLDLEALAEVEISSEDPAYPIEAALIPGLEQGWRASEPGKQTIRLLFKKAQPVQAIQLRFVESALSRTQEYLLRVSQDNGASFLEIARQQWNFSPEGANTELEEHIVELPEVNVIELSITADINDASVRASLEKLRVS